MITYKRPNELDRMRRAGRVVAQVLAFCEELVRPGVTTAEVDAAVESMILRLGGRPSFKGLYGFPATICASVNDEVLHGVPGARLLCEGDLFTVDVGAIWDGYHADAARTFAVGTVSSAARALMSATRIALDEGVAQCRQGRKISDIARAIEGVAHRGGFGVVEGYVGHGIGTSLHEEPHVPNAVSAHLLNHDLVLQVGLVLALEPLFSEGSPKTRQLGDGWTVVTADSKLASHFEDTVAILEDGPEVLTRFPVAA